MKYINLEAGDLAYSFDEIGSAEGFEAPINIISAEIMASRRGGYYLAANLDVRRLSWTGLIQCTDITTVFEERRDAAQVVGQSGLKTMTFMTLDDLELMCEIDVERFNCPYRNNRAPYLIEAVMEGYRFFSTTLKESSISDGGNANMNNEGTAPTNAVFTIHGAGTSFVITNTDTSESLTLTATLGTDDYVTIDTDSGVVLFNETDNYAPFFESTVKLSEFVLETGINNLSFTSIGEDANTLLTINWRDAYFGV